MFLNNCITSRLYRLLYIKIIIMLLVLDVYHFCNVIFDILVFDSIHVHRLHYCIYIIIYV